MRRMIVVSTIATLAIALGPRPAAAATFVPGDEARMASLLNSTRSQRGVPGLSVLDGLTRVARDHSAEMVRLNSLFHNPTLAEDISAAGISVRWHGENVALAPNIDAAYAALLGSASHLENIVRPNYNAVGVGVAEAPSGVIYATQVFAEVEGMANPAAATMAPTQPPSPPPTPAATRPPATPMTPPPPPLRPAIIVVVGGVVVAQPPFG